MEGAYIQGIGYYTCEKLVYDPLTGKLLTNRSLTYHVPLAKDTPVKFHVGLRYNSKNPKGVLGSKSKRLDLYEIFSRYNTIILNFYHQASWWLNADL